MNQSIICGSICTFPKIQILGAAPDAITLCTFVIAVPEDTNRKEANSYDFFECVCVGDAAKKIANTFTKHSKVVVSGRFKNFRFDMVRLGIMLFASIKNNAKIKTLDAINIKSKIINVYKLQPGQSVGYNKGFVAKKR